MNASKRMKDILRAGALAEAMHPQLHHDLADAWADVRTEPWKRGVKWRACLLRGRSMLPEYQPDLLRDADTRACKDTADDPAGIGF